MATLLTEDFEDGWDWAESGGSGSTVDDQYAVSNLDPAPSVYDWGTYCLRSISTGNNAYGLKDLGGAYNTLFARFVLRIEDYTFASSEMCRVFQLLENGSLNVPIRFHVSWHTVFGLNVQFYVHNGGTQQKNNLSIKTEYLIELKFVRNGTCQWKVDGVLQPDQATTYNTAGVQDIMAGCYGLTGTSLEIVVDHIAISDSDWLGAPSAGGGGSAVPLIMQQRRQRARRRRSGLFAIQMPGWIRRESGLLVRA